MISKSKKSKHKAERVVRATRLTWSSLESHLAWAERPLDRKYRKHRDVHGGQRFHKKCVAEYAEIISILSELL